MDETLARARTLAEQLDRPEYLVPLIRGQWAFHYMRAEHKLALALGEQLEKIGEARNDAATQLLGRSVQGASRFFLGEFVAARAALERATGLADPAHRTIGGLSIDPYAAMLTYLALTLACLGYIDQARSRMDEALSEARQLRHAHTLAHVLVSQESDRLAHPLAYGAYRGISGSIDRARFSVLFELGTGYSAGGR